MRDGWDEVPISEVVIRSDERLGAAPEPVILTCTEGAGLIRQSDKFKKRIAADDTSDYKVVRLGDIVYNPYLLWKGAIAQSQYSAPGITSPVYEVLRPRACVEARFLGLVLCHDAAIRQYDTISIGSIERRRRAVLPEVMQVTIPLPPLAEQRRIVDLLVRLDTAATKAGTVAERARTAADALRDDWFRSQAGTSLPLADVVEVTNGRLRSPKNASGPYMTRYIRTANVQDGRLVLDAPMYMNFSPSEQRKYALRVGDVLVTEGSGSRASIGAACRWNGEVAGLVCYQNHLVRLRPRPDRGLSESFIYQWALWAYRSGRFAEIATGTNILSLGVERVAALRMPIGDAAARRRFVELAGAADLVEVAAIQEVASLHQLRSALLGDLLSGDHEIPASYERFFDGAA
jgi:type I restriction enzyme, S subunit